MTVPKIKGIEFDFGGEVLVIPPLSLGSLEVLQDRLATLSTVASALEPAAVKTVVDAAYAALRRNYPEITREQVMDLIDVGNMQDVMAAVMDVAGLRRKQIDEGKRQAGSSDGAVPSAGPA